MQCVMPIPGSTGASLTSKVASIVNNQKLQQLAEAQKMQILEITWEDTARSKDSCGGPNISDLTLQLDKQGYSATSHQASQLRR